MNRNIACTKCKCKTTTKHIKINLTVNEEANQLFPVSARIQLCSSCGNEEYTEKEIGRLRDLLSFYKKEVEKELIANETKTF